MTRDMMQPPPSVDGVTEGVPVPDPMRMIAAMLGPQGTGSQHLMEAITHLKRAGKADPRIQDQVAEALRILTQGLSAEDDQHAENRLPAR